MKSFVNVDELNQNPNANNNVNTNVNRKGNTNVKMKSNTKLKRFVINSITMLPITD